MALVIFKSLEKLEKSLIISYNNFILKTEGMRVI